MKRIILLLLLTALICAACAPRPTDTPPEELSLPTLEESEPSASLPEVPAPAEDDAFYRQALLTFGASADPTEAEGDKLRCGVTSLFYTDDWDDPEVLASGGFFSWYLHMMWQEGLTFEELQVKYASPFGPDTGWFFPQDDFEAVVRRYFDVSVEALRGDTTVYDSTHEGYYIGAGGGVGERPYLVLEAVEAEGNLRHLHIRLEGAETAYKTLTLRLLPEEPGRFYYERWATKVSA